MGKDNIYPSHCKHGNPIYFTMCPGCRNDKSKLDSLRFDEYVSKKLINLKDMFQFIYPDPKRIDKVKVRKDDKFSSLKKSNSQEELKKNYYKLAKVYHPDKGGATKLFQKLQQLYNILIDKFTCVRQC